MLKIVYIMRGVPGSGKSTIAGLLTSQHENLGVSVIHSTDHLCMVDGEYQFDIELAGERHAQNLKNFLGSLKMGIPFIIVDNTNVRQSQYAPYVEAAEAAGYAVVIVELVHPALDAAVERNTHGVSKEIINQMILDWEPSQHCVTVKAVSDAAAVVELLQGRERATLCIGFALGSLVGSLIIALAWLIWP